MTDVTALFLSAELAQASYANLVVGLTNEQENVLALTRAEVPGAEMNDAVADEKKGLLFQARVKLDKASMQVDEGEVLLSPGMAVTVEIAIGKRRVIEFFLDPIRKTMNEGLKER